MFKNAFKCDMVLTTCSKMRSTATWFRQHVPKCFQMRHGFDNIFQNALKCDMVSTKCSKPTKPTNLPTYQPTFIFIFIYCACTTLLCMHNTLVHALEGPGPKARTQQKSGTVAGYARSALDNIIHII